MGPVLLVGVAIAYALLLFGLAWWADRQVTGIQRLHRLAYPFALAVYCTSWTFYGAVGSAHTAGWTYLPIYLGPMLVFLFGARWLSRLVRETNLEAATSISDFISARFGRSRIVAATITILMLAGIVPYLALQLRSIGSSFVRVVPSSEVGSVTLATALILTLFALLFGTRRFDAAGRNHGLLVAVAAESVVKLVAFAAIGLFAIALLASLDRHILAQGTALMADRFAPSTLGTDFIVITCLSAAAIICLPRQFYIGVIEARSANDPVEARWPFIAYLLLTALIVLPITLAGLSVLGPNAAGDRLVIDLPAQSGAQWLVLLAFIGGFSAATAMVVVETVALATMVSNDLIAPLLLRSARWSRIGDMGGLMLSVRRITIALIMAISVSFALAIPPTAQLASIGLVAFAAMVQVLPALILAVDRREGRSGALIAGLIGGGLVWAYTLLLPVLAPEWAENMAGHPLDPQRLFAIGSMSSIVHGTVWSLCINLLLHAAFTARSLRPRLSFSPSDRSIASPVDSHAALINLVERFVGRDRAEATLSQSRGHSITRTTARAAERLLAEVVGAASARALMRSALSGTHLTVGDVTRLLDHGGSSLRFSRDLLAATLENIDPGVSVIDRELNLVAWNSRYLDLFDYPPGMVYVGAPVADLIRHNALRGECGPGEVDEHVERRLAHMQRGAQHSFERTRRDGRVLKTVGGPMPAGGYVMCFTDVTAEAEARSAVEAARRTLEKRVADRTQQLSDANLALAQATAAKTRFLAAASHDLLQPLHAARLFAAALDRQSLPEQQPMVDGISGAVRSAEELLRTLLDISKLDGGGIVPEMVDVDVHALLAELVAHALPLAQERGLSLTLSGVPATVRTDRGLLRSIMQNFLSNALRYTQAGGIVVGVRPRGANRVLLAVYDSGPGIPQSEIERLFREFERGSAVGEGGLGLGLAIVDRSAKLIGAPVHMRSVPGQGSCFGVILPTVLASDALPTHAAKVDEHEPPAPRLRLLFVDDDAVVRSAMGHWAEASGHTLVAHTSYTAALSEPGPWDAALLDFDLGGAADGLTLAEELRLAQPDLAIALITADQSLGVSRRAQNLNVTVIAKPTDASLIDDWLRTAVQTPLSSSPSARAASAA